ncbi:MAG: hypothetical protein J0H74_19390 [Chitinophagaceae bacterium]|nr:hypothetical protein [Chitinophagaceae bacterium]
MKTITSLTVIMTLFVAIPTVFSQPDSVKIKERALYFADSLVKTDAYNSCPEYADLAPASVLKYYGGKNAFIEHFKKIHPRTVSGIDENYPEREVFALRAKDDQWQCVIRVSRYIHKNLKKYHLVTYYLGQSRDDGETWRLFDVSYNSVANIIYLMPDVIEDLPIPQPYIISEEDELAKQQAATPASKKLTPGKK